MQRTPPFFRTIPLVLAFVFAVVFSPSVIAEEGLDTGDRLWQDAITSQIEALRRGDAETALSFAGASFQIQYRDKDPISFVRDIARMGYAPLIASKSHRFGKFKHVEGAEAVVQIVKIEGPEQGLYQALYQMRREEDGWRVWSVMIRKDPGLAI